MGRLSWIAQVSPKCNHRCPPERESGVIRVREIWWFYAADCEYGGTGHESTKAGNS